MTPTLAPLIVVLALSPAPSRICIVPDDVPPGRLGPNGCRITVHQTSIATGYRDTELLLHCTGATTVRTVFEVRAKGDASIRPTWIDANTLRVEYTAQGRLLKAERSLPLKDRTLTIEYVPVEGKPAPGCDWKKDDYYNAVDVT